MTSNQVKDMNRNPTGKGGFREHPELINRDGRPKNEQRFGYWLQFFKNLTINELVNYSKIKKLEDMFVAEAIAYERVVKARTDLDEYKDLANRTEGLPIRRQEITGKDGEAIGISMSYVDALKMIDDELKKVSNKTIDGE